MTHTDYNTVATGPLPKEQFFVSPRRRLVERDMLDSIANFPLRDPSTDELSTALARCFAEYNAWHGNANFIANFANDARIAGVNAVLANRNSQSLDFAEATGVLVWTNARTKSSAEIANDLAAHQLVTAEFGVRIAAVVMLHNAYERFVWRLLRFGIVANRQQVLTRIANRNVTVQVLTQQSGEAVIDEQIEKWWSSMERDTLLKKWDCLVGMFGLPSNLQHESWHFDREMLSRFDEVRHNAVHHGGEAVRRFDFTEFSRQLWRAQLVWLMEVCERLGLKLQGELLFQTGA